MLTKLMPNRIIPIKISDIRQAEDQLNATSKGCLLAALSHED